MQFFWRQHGAFRVHDDASSVRNSNFTAVLRLAVFQRFFG